MSHNKVGMPLLLRIAQRMWRARPAGARSHACCGGAAATFPAPQSTRNAQAWVGRGMPPPLLIPVLLAASLLTETLPVSGSEGPAADAAISELATEIDWKEFLSQQDAVWERLPTQYGEAPFVGNGLLGTIVFLDQRDKNALAFEIGRSDVFDHRDRTFVPINTRP